MTAGVLVLHAWWGLTDDVRAYAERLRTEGYQVTTPDLYHGRLATTRDAAKSLGDTLDKDWRSAMKEVEDAAAKVRAGADRVAILAWSMGVWYSWMVAQAHADRVHALVSYYGLGEVEAGKALPPVLGHFAEDDEFQPLADLRTTEKKVLEGGGVAEFHLYPGTKHWFDEPSRPEFDAAASALAWQRTLAFLDTHLRRGTG
jgi:carboxymethylenebutenolidase